MIEGLEKLNYNKVARKYALNKLKEKKISDQIINNRVIDSRLVDPKSKFDWQYEIKYSETAEGVRIGVTVRNDDPDEAISKINNIYKKLRRSRGVKFTNLGIDDLRTKRKWRKI